MGRKGKGGKGGVGRERGKGNIPSESRQKLLRSLPRRGKATH